MGAKEQIQGYFAFTDEDLYANKRGEYTERQIQKNPILKGGPAWWILILGLGFLGLTIWRGYVMINEARHPSEWIWVVFLLLAAAWMFRSFFNPVKTELLKTEGEVKFIKVTSQTGSVMDADIDRQTLHSYEMWVEGVGFSNANPGLIKYMEGEKYTVYYLSSTEKILSAEKSA